MEQEQFVGFDVSQECRQCVVDGASKVVWQGKCASTPDAMAAIVQRRAPHAAKIAIETGSMSACLSAVSLGNAMERGGTTTAASGQCLARPSYVLA